MAPRLFRSPPGPPGPPRTDTYDNFENSSFVVKSPSERQNSHRARSEHISSYTGGAGSCHEIHGPGFSRQNSSHEGAVFRRKCPRDGGGRYRRSGPQMSLCPVLAEEGHTTGQGAPVDFGIRGAPPVGRPRTGPAGAFGGYGCVDFGPASGEMGPPPPPAAGPGAAPEGHASGDLRRFSGAGFCRRTGVRRQNQARRNRHPELALGGKGGDNWQKSRAGFFATKLPARGVQILT